MICGDPAYLDRGSDPSDLDYLGRRCDPSDLMQLFLISSSPTCNAIYSSSAPTFLPLCYVSVAASSFEGCIALPCAWPTSRPRLLVCNIIPLLPLILIPRSLNSECVPRAQLGLLCFRYILLLCLIISRKRVPESPNSVLLWLPLSKRTVTRLYLAPVIFEISAFIASVPIRLAISNM